MIDYKPTLITNLSTLGLPVLAEKFVDSSTTLPTITIAETYNVALEEANNGIRYSQVRYKVKLWSDTLSDISIVQNIDQIMYEAGFKRINYNELWYGDNICFIMDYQGLGKETYTGGY